MVKHLLTQGVKVSSGVAITDFADLSFTGVTLTARGALIYNTTTDGGSNTTDAVAVLDFGGDKTATIQFPATFKNSVPCIHQHLCCNLEYHLMVRKTHNYLLNDMASLKLDGWGTKDFRNR